MSHKHTIEYISEEAKKYNVELLSTEYINMHTKYLWRCIKSHKFECRANSVLQGTGCSICFGNKKLTKYDMRKIAKKKNIKFLSNKYISANVKHKWQCLKCLHIFYRTPSSIQQGKSCPKCGRRRMWQTRRKKYGKPGHSKTQTKHKTAL